MRDESQVVPAGLLSLCELGAVVRYRNGKRYSAAGIPQYSAVEAEHAR